MSANNNPRRDFIKKTALAGIAGFVAMDSSAADSLEAPGKTDHLTILFQGDSITDGGRGRNNDPNHTMGHGYAFSIASRVGEAFAEKTNMFYNRGISGNKVTDLQNRWQTDTPDLKPDVLSILIGVNDTHSVVRQQNIVTPEKYEEVYRSILSLTKAQLPDCMLVLCERFILPVGKVKDSWTVFNEDIQKRQQIVRTLVKEFDTVFVPLQKIFTDAVSRASNEYWMWDGIHPTYSGHELMAKQWIKEVSKRLKFLKKMHV